MAEAEKNSLVVTLTSATFDEHVNEESKPWLLKFYAPWCGHCKAMAPAWNKIGDEFEGSSSVVIGDVDCTVETDLCSEYGVSGYPTIKVFNADNDYKGSPYEGGRDEDAIREYVKSNLEVLCNVADKTGCDEKETKFIDTVKSKLAGDKEYAQKQVERLTKMKGSKMKADLKKWLLQRLNIVKQLVSSDEKAEL